jgi:hypothetical protein
MEGFALARFTTTRHSRARGNPGWFSAQLAWIPAFAGMSAPMRAPHQHGESPCRRKPQTPKPKVTASPQGGVESNRRRMVGP